MPFQQHLDKPPIYFNEVISLLDLGIPRDAMMLRAPKTEALGGSLFPLDSTALPRSLLGRIAREVEWRGAPDDHRAKNPVDREAKQPKIKEYQRQSMIIGDKWRRLVWHRSRGSILFIAFDHDLYGFKP
jgi:hypothetical protein